ncbi:unnamed protein product, partial [Ectocarpus sp. 6 AP-2014]
SPAPRWLERGTWEYVPSHATMGYSCRLGPAAGGQAKVIVVAKEGDPTLVELERLPKDGSASVLFRGATVGDFSTPEAQQALAEANVLLNCG